MHQSNSLSLTRRQPLSLPKRDFPSVKPGERLFKFEVRLKGVELVSFEDSRHQKISGDSKTYRTRTRLESTYTKEWTPAPDPSRDFGKAVEDATRGWLGAQFTMSQNRGVLYEMFIPGLGGIGGYVARAGVADAVALSGENASILFEIKSSRNPSKKKNEAGRQARELAAVLGVRWPAVRAVVVFVDTRITPQPPEENFILRSGQNISIDKVALAERINRLPVPVITLNLDELERIASEVGHPIPTHLIEAAKAGFPHQRREPSASNPM